LTTLLIDNILKLTKIHFKTFKFLREFKNGLTLGAVLGLTSGVNVVAMYASLVSFLCIVNVSTGVLTAMCVVMCVAMCDHQGGDRQGDVLSSQQTPSSGGGLANQSACL